MLAKVTSAALLGITAYPVEVEVDIAQGLPQFSTVGLPEGRSRKARTGSNQRSKIPATVFPPALSRSILPRQTFSSKSSKRMSWRCCASPWRMVRSVSVAPR